MKKILLVGGLGVAILLVVFSFPIGAPALAPATSGPVTLRFWASWAAYPEAKQVVTEVVRRFERANRDTKVEITYHELRDLGLALRTAFQAGRGPDIFHMDTQTPEFIAAGFAADLSTDINWANVEPGSKRFWTRPGPGGKLGVWALTVDLSTQELYYNRAHFAKLGITVPPSNQFDQEAFTNVVQKCVGAGLAAFATGVGDRVFPGTYITDYLLLHKLGEEDLHDLWTGGGRVTWNDPRVQEVLTYHKRLVDMKAYPPNISAMRLGEAHEYFYSAQKACMMPVASWYTFRAFRPPDQGGQPKDFQLGMMHYPALRDGKGNNLKILENGGSIAVYAKSPHLDKAKQFLNTWTDPQIGVMWVSLMGSMSGIKTDVSKVQSEYKDYFKMYFAVNQQVKLVDLQWLGIMKPEMLNAYTQVMNSAFPAGLISVADATALLERARASRR